MNKETNLNLTGTKLWRANTKIIDLDNNSKNLFEWCLRDGAIVFGWPLDNQDEIVINSLDDYIIESAKKYNNKNYKYFCTCLKQIDVDDLIWIRNSDVYYLGKVTSEWKPATKDYSSIGISGYFSVDFFEVGTVESVPVRVVNSYHSRSTISQISENRNLVIEKTKGIYKKLSERKNVELNKVWQMDFDLNENQKFNINQLKELLEINIELDSEIKLPFKISGDIKNYITDPKDRDLLENLEKFSNNDFIWIKDSDEYYICKVLNKCGFEIAQNDSYKLIIKVNIDSYKIIDEKTILGQVYKGLNKELFIKQLAVDELLYPSLEISKMIYNDKSQTALYTEYKPQREQILDFLILEELEEIISLYLQYEKDLLVYTNKNKIGTHISAFIMINKDGSHKYYPQVKVGDEIIDYKDYEYLTVADNIVYLFATSDCYLTTSNKNILTIEKDYLLDFIYENKNLMSQVVKLWL